MAAFIEVHAIGESDIGFFINTALLVSIHPRREKGSTHYGRGCKVVMMDGMTYDLQEIPHTVAAMVRDAEHAAGR